MTPQERDLITALLNRLREQANAPRDGEAEALIRRAMTEQPDAPYLLVQTVLIEDMALANAQNRIADLERQLAEAKAAAPSSFLGGAGRGSVPSSGPWTRTAPQPMAAPPPVWSSATGGQPMMAPGATSGFFRQAAATAAGVAGGALLFEGIQSLFGPRYGSLLGGMPMQPALSETIINNYYEEPRDLPDTQQAYDDSDQDFGDQDFASDQDFGGDDSSDT